MKSIVLSLNCRQLGIPIHGEKKLKNMNSWRLLKWYLDRPFLLAHASLIENYFKVAALFWHLIVNPMSTYEFSQKNLSILTQNSFLCSIEDPIYGQCIESSSLYVHGGWKLSFSARAIYKKSLIKHPSLSLLKSSLFVISS